MLTQAVEKDRRSLFAHACRADVLLIMGAHNHDILSEVKIDLSHVKSQVSHTCCAAQEAWLSVTRP